MESSKSATSVGCNYSFCTVLFVVFLILKLTHTIDWSWWYITMPLWLPVILGGVFVTIFVLILGVWGRKSNTKITYRR